jgi:hypothetical protein
LAKPFLCDANCCCSVRCWLVAEEMRCQGQVMFGSWWVLQAGGIFSWSAAVRFCYVWTGKGECKGS